MPIVYQSDQNQSMEPLMLSGLTLAGKSIVVNLIGDIYHLARETGYNPEVRALLDHLDLEADLKVVEAQIHQIEDRPRYHVRLSPQKTQLLDDPGQICLDQVHEMISKIKEELEEIRRLTEEHNQKWFAGWRTPGYTPYLEAIRKHKGILDKRVNRLFKTINLQKSLNYT